MHLDPVALKKFYPQLSVDRLSNLDQPGRDIVLLLLLGNKAPTLDPRKFKAWNAWWAQPSHAAMGSVLPKRTPVGQLNQLHRAFAQIGLERQFATRPVREPLCLDHGLLYRLSGLDWPLGLSACLDEIAQQPLPQAQASWKTSFAHAIACKKPSVAAQLVRWAHDQGWSSGSPLIDADTLGTAWVLWSTQPRRKSIDTVDAVLFDLSRSLSTVKSDPDEGVVFWSTIVNSEDKIAASDALSELCLRYPQVWDVMHEKALLDDTVPNAWLLACLHASRHDLSSSLWDTALRAPTTPLWTQRLDWGDRRASPLSAWWEFQFSQADLNGQELPASFVPGKDRVSQALMAIGVLEPGTDEELALGGSSFAFLMPPDMAQVSWFEDNPQWLRVGHAQHANPIAIAHSTAAVDKWIECGFDPAAKGRTGQMALASFLLRRSRGHPKSLAVWLEKKFAANELPTLGSCDSNSILDLVLQLRHEGVAMSWASARLLGGAAPPMPEETEALGLLARAPVIDFWCTHLHKRGEWNKSMNDALWRGLALKDTSEDKEVLDGITKRFPPSESVDLPLWMVCLKQSPNRQADEIIDALIALSSMPVEPMQTDHPAWGQPDIQEGWYRLVENSYSSAQIVPSGAHAEWWAHQLNQRLSVLDEDGHSIIPPVSFIQDWVRCGLPLDAPVLDVIQHHKAVSIQQNTVVSDPWWTAPVIRSALEHAEIASSTPPIHSTTHRRRF